jgi:uncharacterized protein YdhG (YjbR/CyaY superfamily)
MIARRPQTIDQYLVTVSKEQRVALEKLRRAIHATAPKAEECISYGIPAFRLDGKFLVALAAVAKRCAFYPGAVLQAFKEELNEFETSKGTIRFRPDHPLPAHLVRRLVKARMARIA